MIGTKIGGKHAADILYCIKPLSCGISRYSRQNLKNAEKWGSGTRNYLTLWRFGFSNIRAANMIMGLEFVCSKARHRHWYSLRQTVLVEYFKSPKNNISCVKNTWKSLKIDQLIPQKSMIFGNSAFVTEAIQFRNLQLDLSAFLKRMVRKIWYAKNALGWHQWFPN